MPNQGDEKNAHKENALMLQKPKKILEDGMTS